LTVIITKWDFETAFPHHISG